MQSEVRGAWFPFDEEQFTVEIQYQNGKYASVKKKRLHSDKMEIAL